jgi:hypothetical protein
MSTGEYCFHSERSRIMTENPDEARDKAENLREQAMRCRRLAGQTTDREIARKLLELAEEFEQCASKLEDRKRYT